MNITTIDTQGLTQRQKKNIYLKRWKMAHRDSYLRLKKVYRNTFKGRYSKYKYAAKARQLSFCIDLDTFCSIISKPCVYCQNKPLNGIDRINNSVGYEIGNVAPCCRVCNKMKGTMTSEEFILHILKIQGVHKN